jgi:hypothetical protein
LTVIEAYKPALAMGERLFEEIGRPRVRDGMLSLQINESTHQTAPAAALVIAAARLVGAVGEEL